VAYLIDYASNKNLLLKGMSEHNIMSVYFRPFVALCDCSQCTCAFFLAFSRHCRVRYQG